MVTMIRRWWRSPVQHAGLLAHFGATASVAFLFVCAVLVNNTVTLVNERANQPRNVCERYWDCAQGTPRPQPPQEDRWPNRPDPNR